VGGAVEQIRQLEKAEATTDEREEESTHTGKSEVAKGVKVGEEGEGGQDGTGGQRDPGLLAMRDVGGRGSFSERKNGDGKKQGKAGLPGVNTTLSFDDYQRVLGKDKVEEERQLAARKLSMKKGRWERKMEALRSTLENFTPDIRVGNQTALKTRAQPFAVYLARMHRRIHELWGFGFLEFLDGKSSDHPLNDFDLWTDIEVALNPDGSVYKTTIAKTSGNLEFDVAAVGTITSGAPYDATPEVIRSVDQRVYLRWGFYRNWRQCGTFNAHPFILDSVPNAEPLDDSHLARNAKPGRGQRPVTPDAEATTPAPGPVADDRQLDYAANMWMAGFASASVARMQRVSALPFSAGDAVAAETPAELKAVYEGVLVESGGLKRFEVMTAAAFTAKLGVAVPSDAMVLLVEATKARFGVVLTRTRSGEFRATAIAR
jgi:hypothetical protein